MKTIIGAIALLMAGPLAAQTAPAADPHAQHQGADHSQHKGMDHEGHDKGCCKDGKMDCCDKMKQQGKAMDCCAKAAKAAPAKAADHNHDH